MVAECIVRQRGQIEWLGRDVRHAGAVSAIGGDGIATGCCHRQMRGVARLTELGGVARWCDCQSGDQTGNQAAVDDGTGKDIKENMGTRHGEDPICLTRNRVRIAMEPAGVR